MGSITVNEENRTPSIGILGSGALGSNIARGLGRAGVPAILSNSRGPASLASLVADLGSSITAGTTEAAAAADVVVVAVRWVDAPAALSGLPPWDGRIVVDGTNAVEFLEPGSPDTLDPTNPLAGYGLRPVDLHGESSSRILARLVPGARVVRAFNHLDVALLSHPEAGGGRRVLFVAGDDADARDEVAGIIDAMGFFPADLGTLEVGAPLMQVPSGSLATTGFVASR